MSAENVAVVLSVYENFAMGDVGAVLGVFAPDIVWVEGEQDFLPHHGTHHGRPRSRARSSAWSWTGSTSSTSSPRSCTTRATW